MTDSNLSIGGFPVVSSASSDALLPYARNKFIDAVKLTDRSVNIAMDVTDTPLNNWTAFIAPPPQPLQTIQEILPLHTIPAATLIVPLFIFVPLVLTFFSGILGYKLFDYLYYRFHHTNALTRRFKQFEKKTGISQDKALEEYNEKLKGEGWYYKLGAQKKKTASGKIREKIKIKPIKDHPLQGYLKLLIDPDHTYTFKEFFLKFISDSDLDKNEKNKYINQIQNVKPEDNKQNLIHVLTDFSNAISADNRFALYFITSLFIDSKQILHWDDSLKDRTHRSFFRRLKKKSLSLFKKSQQILSEGMTAADLLAKVTRTVDTVFGAVTISNLALKMMTGLGYSKKNLKKRIKQLLNKKNYSYRSMYSVLNPPLEEVFLSLQEQHISDLINTKYPVVNHILKEMEARQAKEPVNQPPTIPHILKPLLKEFSTQSITFKIIESIQWATSITLLIVSVSFFVSFLTIIVNPYLGIILGVALVFAAIIAAVRIWKDYKQQQKNNQALEKNKIMITRIAHLEAQIQDLEQLLKSRGFSDADIAAWKNLYKEKSPWAEIKKRFGQFLFGVGNLATTSFFVRVLLLPLINLTLVKAALFCFYAPFALISLGINILIHHYTKKLEYAHTVFNDLDRTERELTLQLKKLAIAEHIIEKNPNTSTADLRKEIDAVLAPNRKTTTTFASVRFRFFSALKSLNKKQAESEPSAGCQPSLA